MSHDFRIESESPAKDDLMFWAIAGHEALARASTYELTVLSENAFVDAKDILGHAFDVVIEFSDADGGKHERHCQGHAVRFTRGRQVGRYFRYQIRLRSWFWLLTKRANSRILQDKPVLGILDAVFEDSPIKRFKKTRTDNVVGTHPARRYCVQFQESDYNYLSRLLEAEGIYYWFDAHDAPGTMHLSDASGIAHEKLAAEAKLRFASPDVSEARFNEISEWIDVRRFDSGKYASRDVDYKAIKKPLSVEVDVQEKHELSDLEVFEYPGNYFTGEEVDAAVKVHLEEFDGRRERHWGLTPWPDVAAGRSFDFEGDRGGLRDGEYVIGGCVFVASHRGYEGADEDGESQSAAALLAEAILDDAVNADVLTAFTEVIERHPSLRTGARGASAFLITALPVERTFRPPPLTPRVTMPGPQSAIVCGPEGEELHVDEGRVMVHFHWDRYNDGDGKATCWIRCSQPWAGKGWGGYFTPRIGQEVIVEFMNGDPDRPIITGRVYNDDQPIPYKSPTQSGFKTRSTPGGGPANYNEIMFEDKKGHELLNIHAEKNMATTVENDDSGHVMRDQSLTVDRHRTIMVKGKEEHTVMKTQMNHVVQAQTNKFDADTFTTTLGNQTVGTKGKQDTVVNGAVTSHTNSTYTLTTVGAFSQTSASMTVNSVGAVALTSGANIAISSVGELKLATNADRVDASVGAHSIFANSIKAVSNSNLEMFAVGNINATSNGSNTTVLGPNSSGYIGVNSEANMGMARSTFMGLSIDTMMGLSMASCLALQMETAAALKLGFAGVDLSISPVDVEQRAAKVIMPGGGAGAGAGGAFAMGASIGAAIGAVAYSIAAAYTDIKATNQQYTDAAAALQEAATQAKALGLHGMASRLATAKGIAEARRDNGWANPDNIRLHSAPADKAAQYTDDKRLGAPPDAVVGDGSKIAAGSSKMPTEAPQPAASKGLPTPPASAD